MNENERKVFWDTLCSLDGKDLVADRTKLLATIKYPQLLYRYRPVNLKSLEALQENKQFFSSAARYDDPFDTYLRIDWAKVKSIVGSIDFESPDAFSQFQMACKNLNIEEEEIEKARLEFGALTSNKILNSVVYMLVNRIRPKMQQNSFSICFSEKPFNETLWLKYADNHKGFCLIYNPYDEASFLCGKKDKCSNCIITNAIKCLYPVYYSEDKYDATQYAICQAAFTYITEDIKDKELSKELAQKFINYFPMYWQNERVSLIKHKCHEYDEEWRIILGAAPSGSACLRWIPCGVILGLRTGLPKKNLLFVPLCKRV